MRPDWNGNVHIFDIKRFAIHDGPGIRTTVFFRGCPLKCDWCQNPECMRETPGSASEQNVEETAHEIMELVKRDEVYYRQSGGGVTFSGGEPLASPALLGAFLNECQRLGYHTAIDTSGFASQATFQEIAPLTGLFLYDLKLMDDDAHLEHTGVSNRLILENFQWLVRSGAAVTARVPLIPGVTDTKQNLRDISEFLARYAPGIPVELLPFNTLAKAKYSRLGKASKYAELRVQNESELSGMRSIFREAGFTLLGANG